MSSLTLVLSSATIHSIVKATRPPRSWPYQANLVHYHRCFTNIQASYLLLNHVLLHFDLALSWNLARILRKDSRWSSTNALLPAFFLLPLVLVLQQNIAIAKGAPSKQAKIHQRKSPLSTKGLLRCLPPTDTLPTLAKYSHSLARLGHTTSDPSTVAADRNPKRTLLLDTGYF